MSFLDNVLSDKTTPARTESATDEKPTIDVDQRESTGWTDGTEGAATSAAKDGDGKDGKADAKADAKESKDTKAADATNTDAKQDDAKAKADGESEQGRDEKGRFQKTVPQEALHAERQKRQALEAELAKAREVKPPPSVLEDEDGAFNARIAQATQPLQEKLFKLSVKAARNVAGREDYDVVTGAFMDAVDKDPQLAKSFREADDPGEFAYTVGKQIRELSDVGGDILKYGEKKRAEGAAEVMSLKDQIKALQQENEALKASNEKRSKVPQSLNSEQSAAGRDQQFAGPRPLGSILNS